jgi:hypothetical protein
LIEAMAAKILLSIEGQRTIGSFIFRLGKRQQRGIAGSVIGYTDEGVWFQDSRLLRSGEMVLIKWSFIDAILSDVPMPEPLRARTVGFHTEIGEQKQNGQGKI